MSTNRIAYPAKVNLSQKSVEFVDFDCKVTAETLSDAIIKAEEEIRNRFENVEPEELPNPTPLEEVKKSLEKGEKAWEIGINGPKYVKKSKKVEAPKMVEKKVKIPEKYAKALEATGENLPELVNKMLEKKFGKVN